MKYWVQTGENRYKWVCMGADGCVGSQEARGIQKQGKRGVFMGVQVRIWWKRSKMGKYGCKSVRMNAIGCANTGRSKNKIKNSKKQASRTCFWMLAHRGKMQEVGRDGHGGLEGTMWKNRGERRGARCDIYDDTQGGQKKTNNGTKQNEHEPVQICLTR